MANYNYYLARPNWSTAAPFAGGCYEVPAGMLGMLDLRPLPLQGIANSIIDGWFLTWGTGSLGSGAVSLGTGDIRSLSMTTARRSAWLANMGRAATGATLSEVVLDYLTNGCDPVGDLTCPPLMPTRGGWYFLDLAGHSTVAAKRLRWEGARPPQRTLDRIMHLRRQQLEDYGPETTRRALGYDVYRYRLPWRMLAPKRLHRELHSPLEPHTGYYEDFNAADGALGSAAVRLTWAAANGTWNVISNEVGKTAGNVNIENARAEHDLSADDMIAEAELRQVSNMYAGPAVRMASGSTRSFYCAIIDGTTLYNTKLVTGTQTNMQTVAQAGSVGGRIATEADGSRVRSYWARGTPGPMLATTDTAHAGSLRGGICQYNTNAAATLDKWLIRDLAYPVVGATSSNNSGGNASQHTITLPTHAIGDKLGVGFVNDGNATVSTGVGNNWTAPATNSWANSTNCRLTFVEKTAESASESLRLDTSASEGSAHVAYRINAGTFDPNKTFEYGSVVTGSSANPDCPNLDPSWGLDDTLWIPLYGWDANQSHTSYPTNFAQDQVTNRWANTGGCGIAISSMTASIVSVNPGTAVIGSEDWIAQTIALRGVQPTLTPDALSSTTSATAPTLTPGAGSQAPDAISTTSSATAPDVVGGGGGLQTIDATAIPVSSQASVDAPDVDQLLSMDVASSSTMTADPSVTIGVSLQIPAEISTQASVDAPSQLSGSATVDASAAVAESQESIAEPTITSVFTLAPDTMTVATSIAEPSQISGSATLTPDVASGSTSVDSPSQTITASLSPDAIAGQSEAVSPDPVSGSVTVTPGQLESVSTAVEPSAVQGGSPADLFPDAAESPGTAVSPTASAGSAAATVGSAESQSSAVPPSSTAGSVSQAVATIEATAAASSPSVAPGALSQAADTIQATSTIIAPNQVLIATLLPDAVESLSVAMVPDQFAAGITIDATAEIAIAQATATVPLIASVIAGFYLGGEVTVMPSLRGRVRCVPSLGGTIEAETQLAGTVTVN